jgi:predicted ABC-class ATPase
MSPPSLERTYILPNRGAITGMGLPAGITTIVGGGFHGKSTLLQAIGLGVWNHIPGDGREYVVTNPTAVGIRSEDGRSVTNVDISPFIRNLPGGGSTMDWSSEDASGSTSMAASIIEVGVT